MIRTPAAGPAALLVPLRVAVLAFPRAATAQSVNITYGSEVYGISLTTGTASGLSDLLNTLWFFDSISAEQVCNLVNGSLGYPNYSGTGGPFFVYDVDTNYFSFWGRYSTGGPCVQTTRNDNSATYTFALDTYYGPANTPSPSPEASPGNSPEASPSASPEASPEASPSASPEASPEASRSASPEASPSASPEALPSASPEASPSPSPAPLDCSLATFSPPILSSRVTGQICAASKAVRQGKRSKLVTNVTLSLLDANNQPAAINITDIVTNKLTAGWSCKCRPTRRDNCTCLPNAVLLGGGNFLVFPQWRRSTRPGNIVDTTLQVSFTAMAGDGSTCTGNAVICSAWGVRPNKPPPVCAPFNSTGVTRPALTCI